MQRYNPMSSRWAAPSQSRHRKGQQPTHSPPPFSTQDSCSVFTFSATIQQTTELSTAKNAHDTPNLLAPTVAQMVQNLSTMLVWDELAQPQANMYVLSRFKGGWAKLWWFSRLGGSHAFWLRVFSTYDGFIRMEPHGKLRKSCYYQITYHQAHCNKVRDLTHSYSWEAPQRGQLPILHYSTERRDAYPKSAGWWGTDARGHAGLWTPCTGHALQWCPKGCG